MLRNLAWAKEQDNQQNGWHDLTAFLMHEGDVKKGSILTVTLKLKCLFRGPVLNISS